MEMPKYGNVVTIRWLTVLPSAGQVTVVPNMEAMSKLNISDHRNDL